MANITGEATSNVTANVATANQSTVSPITIPIQIQPQIATPTAEVSTTANTTSNATTQEAVSAPTPQTYQGTNSNTNVVDFNQIYSAYQSQYGTNTSNTSTSSTSGSGVKKTSLGTTIVTPTTSNLNSVEGQYQSAYADTINSLISEMLSSMTNGFEYDPTTDSSLKVATEYAANTTLQSLAGSGVLNSSATSERVARIVSELIPTYEEKAHDRWIEYLGQLADTAQLVMNYDSQQFEYWKDAKDREFEEAQFEYQKEQDALENAWKRVDELGYVDNEASTILGVKVGTLSKDAREAKEQREYELSKMREEAEIEYENNVALAKLKSELELSNSKTLANYNTELEKSLYSYKSSVDTSASKETTAYEYELAQKYGTTSLSTYKDIINNNYATYDDYTKQYKATDNTTLYNYLMQEYLSGRLSATNAQTLIAMYGVTEPTSSSNSSIATTVDNSKSTLTSDNWETWYKALDGNNSALKSLGVTIYGQNKSNVNNSDAKAAVKEALNQIQNGTYQFTTSQQLMDDLKNGKFGTLRWGL